MSIADLTPEERAKVTAKAAASRRAVSAARQAAGVPVVSEAIGAFCADCIYDPGYAGGGTWRDQVRACRSKRCPLWPYRPGADPLTELGPDFEAWSLSRVLAAKRGAHRGER